MQHYAKEMSKEKERSSLQINSDTEASALSNIDEKSEADQRADGMGKKDCQRYETL